MIGQTTQKEKVGFLHPGKVFLLQRHAVFHETTTAVGTTGGNDTTQNQENIPQQKGHQFCQNKKGAIVTFEEGLLSVKLITKVLESLETQELVTIES